MYCTEAQFVERFGQEELDQVTATNGGLDYDRAAADADALIDSYLAAIAGRVFALPLATAPSVVVGVAADLVRFNLWANRASEEIRNRRDQAIAWLKDVSSGKAVLLVEGETVAPVGLGMTYRTADRVFTARTLRPFVGFAGCADD